MRKRWPLLEVSVLPRKPGYWEWRVSAGDDDMLVSGFATEKTEAQFRGHQAMFLLLAEGWSP
jgi:hypothetical protein